MIARLLALWIAAGWTFALALDRFGFWKERR